MVTNTVMTKNTQTLRQKLDQEKYCNVLIHCECLRNGMLDQNLDQKLDQKYTK